MSIPDLSTEVATLKGQVEALIEHGQAVNRRLEALEGRVDSAERVTLLHTPIGPSPAHMDRERQRESAEVVERLVEIVESLPPPATGAGRAAGRGK